MCPFASNLLCSGVHLSLISGTLYSILFVPCFTLCFCVPTLPGCSDEMVIHQHRLRRRQKNRKQSYKMLRDAYVPDHTQVLEGVLSEKIRAEIRNADPKLSALPSKSEMKKRHLQRRSHARLHGRTARRSADDSGGGSGSTLAISHAEKRRQELEQLQAAEAAAAGAPATLNSTGTGLSGLMHVPSPDWRE